MEANADIRHAAKSAGVKLWKIADAIDLRDNEFSRKLRKELPPQEKQRIFLIIGELSNQGADQ